MSTSGRARSASARQTPAPRAPSARTSAPVQRASASAPPPRASRELARTLREDLTASGFTVEGVEAALGPVASRALHREQAEPARRVLRRRSAEGATEPVSVLTQLFLLGGQVPRHLLDRALPSVTTRGACELGLVEAAGADHDDPVRPLVDLRPYAAHDALGPIAWWLASDLGELSTGRSLAADHVLGAGGASLTLAQVTMRDPVDRVLDLGTGCGIQALHAARHAQRVTATDISARALSFAAFNAELNGVDIALRQGSMLDPVAGEEFGLVVSNPPFVITPRGHGVTEYEYRDAGRSGDDVVRDLVTGVGEVLAPGGIAQFLGNWEQPAGQDWRARVGEWVDGSGLDAWVIQRDVQDPAEYAETWLRDGGVTEERDPAGWRAMYTAWLDDFASRNVEAVGFGIVTLRKPISGLPTLRRLEEHTAAVHQPLGDHLARCLSAHDWLSARDDDALLAVRFQVAADVTEERYLTPGSFDPNVILLRQGGGLGRVIHASTGLAAFVGTCDGELAAGQIIGAIAALFDVRADDLGAELLPAIRGLIRDGFLVPLQ